jgi:hypothetical protein
MRRTQPSARSITSPIVVALACAIGIIFSPVSLSATLSQEISIPLGAGISPGEGDVLLTGESPFVLGFPSSTTRGNGIARQASSGPVDAISGGCSDEVQADRPDPQRNSSPRGNDSCHLKVGLDEALLLGNRVDSRNENAQQPGGYYGSSGNWIGIDDGLTSGSARAAPTVALTPAQDEVPVPATMLLLIAALPGFLLMRLRRSK